MGADRPHRGHRSPSRWAVDLRCSTGALARVGCGARLGCRPAAEVPARGWRTGHRVRADVEARSSSRCGLRRRAPERGGSGAPPGARRRQDGGRSGVLSPRREQRVLAPVSRVAGRGARPAGDVERRRSAQGVGADLLAGSATGSRVRGGALQDPRPGAPGGAGRRSDERGGVRPSRRRKGRHGVRSVRVGGRHRGGAPDQ